MKSEKNIIDVIEEKLKQLEREKNEIENLYGIDENILEEYTNKKQIANFEYDETKGIKTLKSRTIYANLPKLEAPTKKEIKMSYKTPESLQDSLKYEPDIKDLLEEDQFEPAFSSLNNLKIPPSIKKGYNISSYVEYLNDDYNQNYLN
jgi:hypothetical protein